jgi:hypothetical protein
MPFDSSPLASDLHGFADGSVIERPAVDAARWSAMTLLGVLLLMAAVLVWRRLSGALREPLPAFSLAAVGVLAAVAAGGARVFWPHAASRGAGSGRLDRLVPWLPLPAVLAVGSALSLPDVSPGGLAALWAILALEESVVWLPAIGRRVASRLGNRSEAARHVRFDPPQAPAAHVIAPPVRSDAPPAEEITQQLTRTQSADGVETLCGWLRVDLSPGQRTANVHVAFCPPFGRTPTLEVSQTAGPPTRVKTVQLLPFGARLDVKLPHALDAPASVVLQFTARSQTTEMEEGVC